MKRNLSALLSCILFLFFVDDAAAQSPAELQKQFLQELNSVLKSSPHHHWAFEGEKMKIDSPFAVNKAGILSVTLQYTTDTTNYKVRYTLPLKSITRVFQDIYLILECKDEVVVGYKMPSGSKEWTEIVRRDYMHCGIGEDKPQALESIRHTLSLLLNNKELAPDEYFFREYGVDDKSFSEGLKAVDRNEKYGFINPKHEIVIGFIFDEARDFVEGLAAVKKDGKWGFINPKGELVIPYTYKDVFDFEEGKSWVILKGKSFYIDKKGKKVD